MALVLDCEIVIQDVLTLNFVEELTVEDMLDSPYSKANFSIPRNPRLNADRVERTFLRGQRVRIRMGYLPVLYTEFVGYITAVRPEVDRVRIEMQDEYYALTQRQVAKQSLRNARLRQVLQLIYDGPIECPDVSLGTFITPVLNAVQILEVLQKGYGLTARFRLGSDEVPILVVGAGYDRNLGTASYQVDVTTHADSLTYEDKEDNPLLLRVVNHYPDRKSQSFEVGKPGGNVLTRNYYNQPNAKQFAEEELAKLSYTGYKGSITALGVPRAVVGGVINLTDPRFPARSGSFFCRGRVLRYGNGYDQQIFLGPIISQL
jgi:hypothetical protein